MYNNVFVNLKSPKIVIFMSQYFHWIKNKTCFILFSHFYFNV